MTSSQLSLSLSDEIRNEVSSVESVVTTRSPIQVIEGGLIPTSALHLRKVPYSVARGFLMENHYLHRIGVAPRLNLGVFVDASLNAACIGVLMWSVPVAANRLRDGDVTLELTRMCILDCTTKNAESRCLGISARIIRSTFPDIRYLIAYADIEGMGHKGTIYKASGWTLDGDAGQLSWKNRVGRRDRGSGTRKLRFRKTLSA
jgi:hypothetical protein